jgi:TPR repeat protein
LKRAEEERIAPPRSTQLTNEAVDALEANATAQRLMKRGQEFLEQGNVLIARQYFMRASEGGLAAAAFKLAETYDAAELRRHNAYSVVPDAAAAKRWYMRALDLGAVEASARLVRFGN